MRVAIPAVLVLVVASLALFAFGVVPTRTEPGAVPAAQGPEVAPAPRERQPDPARDLKLVAAFEGKYVHVSTSPPLVLTVVNTSKTFTYPVLKPRIRADEPRLAFAAEQLSFRGAWERAELVGGAGCGLHGVGQPVEVSVLKPGEKLTITSDYFPFNYGGFRYPGRVRMTVQYAYLMPTVEPVAGPPGGPGAPGPVAHEPPAALRGVKPFRLVAEPVEFDVVTPLNLAVRVKRPLKVGEAAKLSDLLDVTLKNATGEVVALPPVGAPGTSLRVNFNTPLLAEATPVTAAGPGGEKVALVRNETAALLGAGPLANGADATWKGAAAGKFPICVEYSTAAWKDGEKLFAFAEVAVEK